MSSVSTWIANLSLRGKFGVLGLVALTMAAVPSGMVLRDAVVNVGTLQKERDALPPARATLELIRLTQEHRGLSAAVLSGDAGKQPDRQSRQQAVDQTFGTLGTQLVQAGQASLQ